MVQDPEVYDLCKDHQKIRRLCIQGAFRRYSLERHFYEDVEARRADFVVILDTLINIEKVEIEKQRKKRTRKRLPFPLCWFTKKCDPPIQEDIDLQETFILSIIEQAEE